VGVSLGIALLPAGARAESGSPLSVIPVYGTVNPGTYRGTSGATATPVKGGTFAGFFTVSSFTVQTNQLLAPGTLAGSLALVDTTGTPLSTQPVSQTTVVLPLSIDAGATCQALHLQFGPLNLALLGLTVRLNAAAVALTPQSAPGAALVTPLCQIATTLAGKTLSLTAVATQLQQVLLALNGVSPLRNIALMGTTAAGGLIPGAFSVDSFTVDPNNPAQLQAVGSFTGIAPNSAGQPVSQTQSLTIPVTVDPSSSCQLLLLTFGPLYQNLLGAVTAVSPVALNITAAQGGGNLLCGVATALSSDDLTGLASLLNQVAGALQGTATTPVAPSLSKTIPISLTAADGQQFTGSLTLTGFVTENNTLFANGRLVGSLTAPTGRGAGQINMPVLLIPVTPTGASCQSLTLNLGPLDVSLVGVGFSLSAVRLNITLPANANAGLGNLLCVVANVLDQQPTNLNTLVVRLDQLLNLLT
jgi:hypothetical protein